MKRKILTNEFGHEVIVEREHTEFRGNYFVEIISNP
jgi:hypothetical protein